MVKLDYRTNNPRWGLKGVIFKDWESYSFTLGYLCNIRHYSNQFPNSRDANISIHIEGNDEQGAWNKEGRIHYYGSLNSLMTTFHDLYDCSSAGTGNITRRINSNGYILSLIDDYEFDVVTYRGYTTADVFPPTKEIVENHIYKYLQSKPLTESQVNTCMDCFRDGYLL